MKHTQLFTFTTATYDYIDIELVGRTNAGQLTSYFIPYWTFTRGSSSSTSTPTYYLYIKNYTDGVNKQVVSSRSSTGADWGVSDLDITTGKDKFVAVLISPTAGENNKTLPSRYGKITHSGSETNSCVGYRAFSEKIYWTYTPEISTRPDGNNTPLKGVVGHTGGRETSEVATHSVISGHNGSYKGTEKIKNFDTGVVETVPSGLHYDLATVTASPGVWYQYGPGLNWFTSNDKFSCNQNCARIGPYEAVAVSSFDEQLYGWYLLNQDNSYPSAKYTDAITERSGTFGSLNKVWLVASFGKTPDSIYIHYHKNTEDTVTNMPSDATGSASGGITISGASSNTPKRTGYTFLGWALSSNADSPQYDAGTTYIYKRRRNLDLYAVWEENSYTATFRTDGGTWHSDSTTSNKQQEYGITDTLVAPSYVTKTGYTFAGWKVTTAAGSWNLNDNYYTSATSTKLTGSNGQYGDVTFTAQWTARKYTINYDGNGSTSGSVQSQTKTYGESLTLRANSFSRTGYSEDITKTWNTKANGTGTALTPSIALTTELISNPAAGGTSSTTLYALWSINGYTATFKPNNGVWSDSTTDNKTKDFTITTGLKAPDTISRTGYTFDVWKVTSRAGNWDSGATYPINNTSTNFDGTPGKWGNVTFTSQWNVNSYSITYTLGGGVQEHSNNQLVDDSTYTYVYNPTHVNYDNSQYTASEDHQRNSYFRVDSPTRDGYKFLGWTITGMDNTIHNYYLSGTQEFTSTTFDTSSLSVKSPPMRRLRATSGTVKFTAQWEAKSYTLKFKPNVPDDTQSIPTGDFADRSVTYGQPYNLPENPNRVGYTFKGWYTAATGGTKKTSSDTFLETANQTLYAQWTIKSWNINFNTNGGSEVASIPFNIETTFPKIIRSTSTRFGYTFAGWSSSSTGSDPKIPYTISTNPQRNVQLYAVWRLSLVPFTPKPGEPPEDQEYFGVPIDELDPSCKYTLKLSVKGDRTAADGKSKWVLESYQGEYKNTVPYSWENTIKLNEESKLTPQQLRTALQGIIVFPMDVWRCRIHNPSATLHVSLTEYQSDAVSLESTIDEGFVIADDMIPTILSSYKLKEGVENIRQLDLYNNSMTSTKRFIGNAKSSVLIKITSSSKKSGVEKLYDAVPQAYATKLEFTGTPQEGSDWSETKTRLIDPDLVQDYITNSQNYKYNDTDEYRYSSNDMIVSEIPFPKITADLDGARIRLKVFDTRHSYN